VKVRTAVERFVSGIWSVEQTAKSKKRRVRLVLKPFHKLDKRARLALEQEGERLVRFIQPDAETYTV
jgi:hypothetical protein